MTPRQPGAFSGPSWAWQGLVTAEMQGRCRASPQHATRELGEQCQTIRRRRRRTKGPAIETDSCDAQVLPDCIDARPPPKYPPRRRDTLRSGTATRAMTRGYEPRCPASSGRLLVPADPDMQDRRQIDERASAQRWRASVPCCCSATRGAEHMGFHIATLLQSIRCCRVSRC